jgi:hypothetical protein
LNDKAFHFGLDEEPFVCKAFGVIPLDDGTYDVLVIDAIADLQGDDVHLELAFTSGSRKGDVVPLRATALRRDPLLLLGLPATPVVTDGMPSLTFD